MRVARGPRGLPLLGNLGVLRGILPFLVQQWQRHGDIFRVELAGNTVTVLTHPDPIQDVLLTRRENFTKGRAYDPVRRLLGEGLVTLNGNAWKSRHTLVQPAFHRRSLEKLTAIMVTSGARFFDRLAEQQGTGEETVDIHRVFVRLTLDVVIAALFGEGTLDSAAVSYETLSGALELLSEGFNGFRLPDWVPSPKNRKFQRTTRELDQNMFTIIERARQNRDSGGAGSLLAMLLDSRDEVGGELTSQDLRNEVLTLFMAGHETTALTLTWLFTLLDQRDEVVARMREEVDTVLCGRDPTFEDVAQLPYIRRVVDETLRIRPVAAMVARNVVQDDQVGGFSVSRDDMVMPFIWGLHRHPDFWSNPEHFDPDRFLSETERMRDALHRQRRIAQHRAGGLMAHGLRQLSIRRAFFAEMPSQGAHAEPERTRGCDHVRQL
jgi:cytochrome P450